MPDHYRRVANGIAGWFTWAVDLLAPLLGEPFAVVAILVLMAPLAMAFVQICRVLIPRFMKLYYEETVEEKARHYWRRKCVGTGMTQSGAHLSIIMGVAFYFLLRIVVALPMYYKFTVPALVVAFLGVTALGFFCRGKIPRKASAWWRYCRKFQAPTITGMGLGAATIILDFVIRVGIDALTYLHAA
jgi:hypothetical protein